MKFECEKETGCKKATVNIAGAGDGEVIAERADDNKAGRTFLARIHGMELLSFFAQGRRKPQGLSRGNLAICGAAGQELSVLFGETERDCCC